MTVIIEHVTTAPATLDEYLADARDALDSLYPGAAAYVTWTHTPHHLPVFTVTDENGTVLAERPLQHTERAAQYGYLDEALDEITAHYTHYELLAAHPGGSYTLDIRPRPEGL